MTRITVTIVLLLAALVLAAAAGAHTGRADQTVRTQQPEWLPDVWWRLAVCETRGNWRHDSGTYQGAFGIYKGTWDTYRIAGFPVDAHLATPKQQYRVARAIAAKHSMYAWGCYRVVR